MVSCITSWFFTAEPLWLSHKKEKNLVICRDMDGSRDSHTEWISQKDNIMVLLRYYFLILKTTLWVVCHFSYQEIETNKWDNFSSLTASKCEKWNCCLGLLVHSPRLVLGMSVRWDIKLGKATVFRVWIPLQWVMAWFSYQFTWQAEIHSILSFPTLLLLLFFFKYQNTLKYIHVQWPHFWVKERQRLGYPGLSFSWSTFSTTVPFLSSLFYLLWFPSGLGPLIFFILMLECLSLFLLRQLFPINPHLFFLSCSVILSFLFHNPLSEFLLSIWATWSSPFLEWRQKKVFVVVVQSLNPSWLFATPWTAARQAPLPFTISEFAQIHVHWVRDAI